MKLKSIGVTEDDITPLFVNEEVNRRLEIQGANTDENYIQEEPHQVEDESIEERLKDAYIPTFNSF